MRISYYYAIARDLQEVASLQQSVWARDIRKSLETALLTIAGAQTSLESYGKRIHYSETELRDLVDALTLGAYELRERSEPSQIYTRILKVAAKDKELRAFIVKELQGFKEVRQKQLARIEAALKTWKE